MDERFHKLEKTVDEIRAAQADIKTGQAVVNQAIDGIQRSLAVLTDLRSETLHLVKMQALDKQDHDEIFSRLRATEKNQEVTAAGLTDSTARVKSLESNQWWGVMTCLGLVLAAAFKKLFGG